MHACNTTAGEWPAQIKSLPRNHDGLPVPLAFVLQERRLTPRAGWLTQCANHNKCWVCGRPLTRHSGFLLSIRAVVVSLTEEPPAHPECVMFPLQQIRWQSGIVALWVGKNITRRAAPRNALGYFELGKPLSIEWYASGEPAALESVQKALNYESKLLVHYFSDLSPQAAVDIHARVVNARGLLRRRRPACKGNISHVYKHTRTG